MSIFRSYNLAILYTLGDGCVSETSREPPEKLYYARVTKDGRRQTLQEHTERTAKLAHDFAEVFGAGKLAETIARYHDFGKKTMAFQDKLLTEEIQGKVRHSIYGAKHVYEKLSKVLPIAEMLANCITSHHGKLRDYLSPEGVAALAIEMAEGIKDVPEVEDAEADSEILVKELKTILALAPDKAFAMTMLTKLLYSCLVDADRLDAYMFEIGESYSPAATKWDEVLQQLEIHLTEKTEENEMSGLRRSVSSQCAEAGNWEQGIYQLSVPTGGGKTLSSLRFALTHAAKHKMSRIIYVVPYLSILEQTALAIREAIGADDEIVLEHHSNILPDDAEYYKLLTDRWDTPIILTTQVQFLESVFSARGSDLRKLHSMANSVIIFDEVQSLPVKCVHLFNSAVNFLHKTCKSTILLCTATQPLLDTVEKPILLSAKQSIALCENVPVRTNIVDALRPAGYTYPELADFIISKHKVSALVIVNTKAAAKALFRELREKCVPVVHLSTNMCPAHRDKVFKDLRNKLGPKSEEPIICVSTQLIEAGVDISFECVIRDIAGLDSLYQAFGRCNRHGEFGEAKNVYVVNIKGENLSKLPDIRIGAEITRRLFDYNNQDIDMYYQHYFHARKELMGYPTDYGTIYDLLTCNTSGSVAYKNRGHKEKVELRAAIRSAADSFFVIAPGQKDVVVPYENAMELLEDYVSCNDLRDKQRLIKALGRNSVSLYESQIKGFYERRALSEEGGICYLSRGFYDSELGIDIDGKHEFLCG